MMNDIPRKVNPVLRAIMHQIYQDRPPLPLAQKTSVRLERTQNKAFCDVWFMTEGCSHDCQGGCTMCNYGKGHLVSQQEILDCLAWEFKKLPSEIHELIVTPTGSMLDDQEVPPDFRRKIFGFLNNCTCDEFILETRAETITEEKLLDLKRSLRSKKITIELGIESTDEWVLRNCVNKNMELSDVHRAVKLIHGAGLEVCGNVGIGIPFISERCSIELAKKSIRDLFEMGFDSVVLLPYHVKPGTLCAYLWKAQRYSCCSLWAIPEVLSAFTPEECIRISISWYRNYYTDPSKILSSPTLCHNCEQKTLLLFDEYKNHPGSQSLAALNAVNCACRRRWRDRMQQQCPTVEFQSIAKTYQWLAELFSVDRQLLRNELDYMQNTLKG